MTPPLTFFPGLMIRAPYYPASHYAVGSLAVMLKDPLFRNALWLASPQFYRGLQAKNFEEAALNGRERLTLLKYMNRMCHRPIPFGAFASFSLASWSETDEDIQLSSDEAWLHLQPDQQLRHIWNLQQPLLLATPVALNAYLYRIPKQGYRFLCSEADARGRYGYHLLRLPAERFYQALIRRLSDGAIQAGTLQDWLCYRTGCTAAVAWAQIKDWVAIQLLVTPRLDALLQPEPPGEEESFGEHQEHWHYTTRQPMARLPVLAAAARTLLAQLERHSTLPEPVQPFYSALERQVGAGGLNRAHQTSLLQAVQALRRLVPPPAETELTRFHRAFTQRFDRQRVPLLQALDPDLGVAYAGGKFEAAQQDELADLQFPVPPDTVPTLAWTEVHRLLLRRWLQAPAQQPAAPLQLTDADIASLPEPQLPLPATLPLLFRLNSGKVVLDAAGGASATALAGRFSEFSPTAAEFCRSLAAAEVSEHPEAVLADITLVTDTHVDNINRRRAMYAYELPLSGTSAFSAERQLALSDLRLSVQGGTLLLESERLGKPVVPRLSTAFNYTRHELPLFRFLCDLQHQGLHTRLHFDLADYFPGMRSYPRVIYHNCILAPAQWFFTAKEVAPLLLLAAAELPAALAAFRQQHHLPAAITLGSFDQLLVFDLNKTEEAAFWCACIKGLAKIHVKEYLCPDPGVLAGGAPLSAQFLAVMRSTSTASAPVRLADERTKMKLRRDFLLGSSWLYLKLFCTPVTADLLLRQVIGPFMRRHRRYLQRWFFIRYTEDGNHLRLRLQVRDGQQGWIMTRLQQALARSGYDQLLHGLQASTYQREVERYSPALMEPAEALFQWGSEAVLWWLNKGEQAGVSRFNLAILLVDQAVLGLLPVAEHGAFYQWMVTAFLKEFQADTLLKNQLNQQYRHWETALRWDLTLGSWPASVRGALSWPPAVVQQLQSPLRALECLPRWNWVSDVIHMQLNRVFASAQRRQELRVYYFLDKHRYQADQRSRADT